MSSKTNGDTPSNVFRGFIDMPGHSRRYIFRSRPNHRGSQVTYRE